MFPRYFYMEPSPFRMQKLKSRVRVAARKIEGERTMQRHVCVYIYMYIYI